MIIHTTPEKDNQTPEAACLGSEKLSHFSGYLVQKIGWEAMPNVPKPQLSCDEDLHSPWH